MAYTFTNSKGITYVLHGRETILKNGSKRMVYFFAKDEKEGLLDEIPEGYAVLENRNGLPVVRKLEPAGG